MWERLRKLFTSSKDDASQPPAQQSEFDVRDWCPFWNHVQRERFEKLVVADFRAQGHTVQIDEGAIAVGEQTYGLDNLAQYCRAIPDEEWSLAIEQHFAGIRRSEAERAEWDAKKSDFAWAEQHLCVRIYGGEHESIPDIAGREDFEETRSVLVADLPSIAMTIQEAQLKDWGRDLTETLTSAIARTVRANPVSLEWHEADSEKRPRMAILHADHFYVCTHAFALADRPELSSKFGRLLAMPNRHTLLAYPIAQETVFAAIQELCWISQSQFEKGPGSIVPHLYWDKPDATGFELQRIHLAGGSMQFHPGPDFQEMLEANTE